MVGRIFRVFRGAKMRRSDRFDSDTADGTGEAIRGAFGDPVDDGDEVVRGLLRQIDELFGGEDGHGAEDQGDQPARGAR